MVEETATESVRKFDCEMVGNRRKVTNGKVNAFGYLLGMCSRMTGIEKEKAELCQAHVASMPIVHLYSLQNLLWWN